MSRMTVGRIEQLTHTPGPWEPEYLYDGGRTIAQIRSRKTLLCVNAAAHPQLDQQGELKSAEQLEVESLRNAHLIAAAPELLSALRRMLECHQAAMDAAQSNAVRFVEKRCECGACDEARAAIAKVEGRA